MQQDRKEMIKDEKGSELKTKVIIITLCVAQMEMIFVELPTNLLSILPPSLYEQSR